MTTRTIKEVRIPKIDVDSLTLIRELLELGYKNKYNNDCSISIEFDKDEKPQTGTLTFLNPDETVEKILAELQWTRGCQVFTSGNTLEVTLSPEITQLIIDNKDSLQHYRRESEIDALYQRFKEKLFNDPAFLKWVI